MKHFLLIFFAVLLFSCAKRIVYVPYETIRTEKVTVHDTLIDVQLVPIRDSVSVRDTFSLLSNKYSYSSATWHSGLLNHSLVIKDISIPVRVQYVTVEKHDTTTKTIVREISKVDQNKIKDFDKVKEKASKRLGTIWSLIGVVFLLTLWTFRKLILKLVKPI